MDRVKVSDRFAFPLALDLGGLVGPEATPGGLPPLYELAAVMLHKGASAVQGHYGGLMVMVKG